MSSVEMSSPDLQQHGQRQLVGDGVHLRDGVDVDRLLQPDPPRLLLGQRRHQHGGVDARARGQRHLGVGDAEVARVGDDARQRRGGRGLRAAQEHPVLARAGAAREVARHRAQAVAAHRRRLPHADAAVAAGLVDAPAGADEVAEQPLGDQVLEHLARGRVDVEGHAVVDLPAADHLRRDREVAVAGVGRGADVGLVDILARYLPHGHHIAGARRLGDERLDTGEVQLLVQVVARRPRRGGSPPSPLPGPRRAGIVASPRPTGTRWWWRPSRRPCWR